MDKDTFSNKSNRINEDQLLEQTNFLDFLTPSMAIESGTVLLAFLSLVLLFVVPFIGLIITLNSVSANLLLLGLSQLIGFFIVRFGFIPLFKSREIIHNSLNLVNFRVTLIGFLVGYAIVLVSNYIIIIILTIVNVTPQTGYGSITLTPQVMNDPFTLAVYFLVPTLGAGVFEELVYRRMTIPLLEERGMSPISAVLAAAFIFALSHLPNDLINGNLAGGVVHVWAVFVIGTFMGIIYIITRNIIYPMIMHAVYNLVSFYSGYIAVTNNIIANLLILVLIGGIIFSGIGLGIYLIVQFFRRPDKKWVQVLHIPSRAKIAIGFIGYLIITTIVLIGTFFLDIGISIAIATGFNVILVIILYSIIIGVILAFLLWIGHAHREKAIRVEIN